MPYISDKNKRQMLKPVEVASSPGELNYQIFVTMLAYLENREVSYDTLAEALSACHEAGGEFRRRILVPYEDDKIAENGDILPTWLEVILSGN